MNRRDFARTFGAVALAITPGTLRQVNDLTSPLGDRSPEDVATDQDFWFQIRHAFTIDRNQNFLNSGSVSPAPRVVQEAMNQYMTIMNMSPSLWVDELLIPQREHVRRRLAETFGCDPEELAITRNTSEALEAVQLGLRLEAGDEILTTTQDYPRMIECWRQRERRDGVVLRQFAFPVPPPSMDDLYRRFEQAITPRTRVIHFCHITYTTGQIFPVKRICQMARERGIETIVDGAHAFAHFPFDGDALGCDYYGTSLHKWLTAPVGTGFLYIRRDKIRNVWPLFTAPPSMDDNIRKFEQIGTYPVAPGNAITEALTFYESIGPERKAARLRYLRNRWMRRVAELPGVRLLTPTDPAQACAIGTMNIDGIGAQELTDYLYRKHRIHVRPRVVANEWEGIRVTPNVFTTVREVDAFSEAIEQVVHQGL